MIRGSVGALLLGSIAVRALTACAHGDPASAPPAAHSTLLQPTTVLRVDRRMGVTEAQGPSSTGALEELAGLDDAELSAVVEATYGADVAHLQLALARAVTPAVLHFASDFIEDCRAQASQDESVFAALRVIPNPCAASQRVAEEWQSDGFVLQAAPASDFDRTFVNHHVSLDLRAVAVLDAVIASARSPSLRAQLQSDRTSLAGHMRQAQHLQQSLSVP